MLSYRHSFHAGNFADVLKHCIAIHIFDHMLLKNKPMCYLDTHAGCGGYSLSSKHAQKTKEFNNGIFPLWNRDDLPAPVARYVDQVKTFNAQTKLEHYPGSPSIAHQMLRSTDRIFLYELHPNEFISMKENFAGIPEIKMFNSDGLKGVIANMPPISRRGFVLIDPSYEVKTEYTEVVETLIKAYKRFATGTYAVWYPVVSRSTINKMETELRNSGIKNIQLFELGIQSDSSERGMSASGMIVINPPWTLKAAMEESLPFLAKILGENKEGNYRIKTLSAE